MIDKEEQRRRAAQFSQDQLAAGAKIVSLPRWPVTPGLPITPGGVFGGQYSKPATTQSQMVASAPTKPATAPKPKKLTYEVKPGTNRLNQVIQPGQKIVVITAGYNHSVNIREGIFLGVRGSSFVVSVKCKKFVYRDANGNVTNWRSCIGAKSAYEDIERQTTLQSNNAFAIL